MESKLFSILILAALAIHAQDTKPPEIPAEVQRAYEQARANEKETAAAHDADVAKLRAASAAVVAACGDKYEPGQTARDQPFTCVLKNQAEAKPK